MVQITVSREDLTILINDKEYYFPAQSVELHQTDSGRIEIRQTSDNPLELGELLWDFPYSVCVIEYLP